MKKTKIKKDLSNRIKEIGSGNKVRGITLISLVITIVVLIILAAVAINLSLGENGLFSKAKTATVSYTNAQRTEETEIAKATNEIDSYVDNNRSYSESELQQKIQEALAIRDVKNNYNITFNEDFVNTSTSKIEALRKSGNTIELTFRLHLKSTFSPAYNRYEAIYNLPKPSYPIVFYTTIDNGGIPIRSCLSSNGTLYVPYWHNTSATINPNDTLMGTLTYLTTD